MVNERKEHTVYATTALTPAEQAKVPAGAYTPLLWAELEKALSLPSGSRPRIYGYLEPTEDRGGEIVAIRSQYYLDEYAGRLSFAWLSGTTIADLVRAAR